MKVYANKLFQDWFQSFVEWQDFLLRFNFYLMPKDVTVSFGHSCVINHPQTWRLIVTAVYFTLVSVGWWFRLPHSYMYAGWFWFWGLTGCWLLGWWGNQARRFSSPAGWPGLVHAVVADSQKQSRRDQGLLRPRLGTGTAPWHGIAKSQNQTDSEGRGNRSQSDMDAEMNGEF